MVLLLPHFLDSVVAIGLNNNNDDKWYATGFFYGYLTDQKDNMGLFEVYLVTNRHVIDTAIKENHSEILLKFNSQDGGIARESLLNLYDDENRYKFFTHPDKYIDIAIIPIESEGFDLEKDLQFIQSNESFTVDELKDKIGEGDFIYVLGFPMGNVGTKRTTTIVRSGSIARISDLFNGENNEFLIDSLIFPGNSGGPVFMRPELHSVDIGKTMISSSLIGIVKDFIPYYDEAYSNNTGNLRVTFEDNSGLASVHPMDYINETIIAHLKGQPKEKLED